MKSLYFRSIPKTFFTYIKYRLHRGVSLPVLMYHSVGDNGEFFNVSLEKFERQMEHLHKMGYKVLTLIEFLSYLEGKLNLPSKSVLLTFDDGYEDNYTHVFPLLKKYNFPATIFLTTGWVGDKMHLSKNGFTIPMLDWVQIKEMYTSGLVEFEPHTISHPRLTELAYDEAVREITQSKEFVERSLGKTCLTFAYPYGNFDEHIEGIVRSLFAGSFTVNRGFVDKKDNAWRLRRNTVDSLTSMLTFRLKI